MKKTSLMTCATLALALTLGSCKCDKSCDNDTAVFNKEQSDSLSAAYGKAIGLYLNENLAEYQAQTGEEYNKEEFLKGLQYILGHGDNEAFNAGVYSGMQMLGDIKKYNERGAQIDMNVLMSEMRKCILADSVSDGEAAMAQGALRSLDNRLQELAQKRHIEELENSPAAKENLAKAEAFVAKTKAENPDVVSLGDSILYVVEQPGNGAPATDGQIAYADVVISKLDGSIVNVLQRTSINTSHYVPGLTDAVKAVGIDGKAKAYVMGKTAFGIEGNPNYKLGPNEMVVYTVTVKDIQSPKID